MDPLFRLEFRAAGSLAALGFSLLLSTGCGEAGPELPSITTGTIDSGVDTGPCEPGEVRRCSITLDRQEDILTCYHGVQVCSDGVFGACENGQVVEQIDMSDSPLVDGTRKPLALSMAVPCGADNPCDPECQVYIEDPPDITGNPGSSTPTTTYAFRSPTGLVTGRRYSLLCSRPLRHR